MSGKLTKRVIETAPVTGKSYFIWDAGDGAVKGFGVNITPTGKRTFAAQFRIGSGRAAKSKRVTVGGFGVWTVEQARDRARDLIREGEKGIDRQALDEATRLAAEAARAAIHEEKKFARNLRLNRLAARFMKEHVRIKRKPTTTAFYRHSIAAHIPPALGKKDAREITRVDLARPREIKMLATEAASSLDHRIRALIYGKQQPKAVAS